MFNLFTNLDHLKLSNNRVDGKAANALSQCENLKGLSILDIKGCHLSDKGLEMMMKAHFVSSLKTLILEANDLTDEGAVCLSRAPLFNL